MFNLFRPHQPQANLVTSKLYDEKSFYKAFINDLNRCEKEVIIESPFITNYRAQQLRPIFQILLDRGVKIYIITRHPQEHVENLMVQAEGEIAEFEIIGVQVLLCTRNHHRKLAILDRKVLWEGSLNILSQTYSREIMRRIQSRKLAEEMFHFLKLGRFL